MQRDMWYSSQFNANRNRRGFSREVPFVIKPAVIKTTNIKLNFITAGFSRIYIYILHVFNINHVQPKGRLQPLGVRNWFILKTNFPVLCASPSRLPLSSEARFIH